MIDLDQYQRLKKRADKAKSDAAKAEGALEELTKKLKEEFQVETLEDAEILLVKLQVEEKELEGKYKTELLAFETQWGEKV